jgi:hypothetical protein
MSSPSGSGFIEGKTMRTSSQPTSVLQLGADVLDDAAQLATDCAGETWRYFAERYFDALPQMQPATLIALAAELFVRSSTDQARFVFVYAHEARQPSEQRRTPEQLLEHMRANGFQAPSTLAQRRAEAAYLRELEQPPLSPDAERTARLAYVREQVQLVLTAGAEQDFIRPEHRPLLEAMPDNDSDLDEEQIGELLELCAFYTRLTARAQAMQDTGSVVAATPRSTRLH